MAEHTPWIVVRDSYRVNDEDGYAIADSDGSHYLATGLSKARAEHIVECVNAHDELVAALESSKERNRRLWDVILSTRTRAISGLAERRHKPTLTEIKVHLDSVLEGAKARGES